MRVTEVVDEYLDRNVLKDGSETGLSQVKLAVCRGRVSICTSESIHCRRVRLERRRVQTSR